MRGRELDFPEFPDPSQVFHLRARTEAANFRNSVRADILEIAGEFLVDEFNPHEHFPPGADIVLLDHWPNTMRGCTRVKAHVKHPNGDAADVEFDLPPVALMREAKRTLGALA